MRLRSNTSSTFLLGVLAIILIASSVYCSKKEEKPPGFYVSKTTVSLGTYYEGQDITHTFVVRNVGAGPLHIENVKPG